MSPDQSANPGSGPGSIAQRLNRILAGFGQAELDSATAARFETYLDLLLRWNAKTNLTAIRDTEGILTRHFAESIACARAIPSGIQTLLDFGSGAGFPGMPIALCRPDIQVTLAESQGKKAAFLREAARVLAIGIEVHGGRAEAISRTFDCVTLRAVDRMEEAIRAAASLVSPAGWLAPLTTERELAGVQAAAGAGFQWHPPVPLPGADARLLMLGQRLG